MKGRIETVTVQYGTAVYLAVFSVRGYRQFELFMILEQVIDLHIWICDINLSYWLLCGHHCVCTDYAIPTAHYF